MLGHWGTEVPTGAKPLTFLSFFLQRFGWVWVHEEIPVVADMIIVPSEMGLAFLGSMCSWYHIIPCVTTEPCDCSLYETSPDLRRESVTDICSHVLDELCDGLSTSTCGQLLTPKEFCQMQDLGPYRTRNCTMIWTKCCLVLLDERNRGFISLQHFDKCR